MGENESENILFDQPTTFEERLELVDEFITLMDYDLPIAVDLMEDAAEKAYSAWPERLYVIGADGKVSYKGGIGPDNFNLGELEDWLVLRFGEREEPESGESKADEPKADEAKPDDQ